MRENKEREGVRGRAGAPVEAKKAKKKQKIAKDYDLNANVNT